MIQAFVRKHSVAAYFALTFAISWGGVLGVVGPGGFPGTPEQFQTLLPIAVAVMIAGPSIAGLVLTGLVYGRAGYREFGFRLLKWRMSPRWYAALLIAPALMMTLLLALASFSQKFLPGIVVSDNRAASMFSGLAIALGAGILEELGWTGFATPELRRRYGTLATGIILGAAWAAWHLLVGVWASGTVPGRLTLASYLLDPFLFLGAFRVLMVWVYDCTESLFVAILMHVSLTASARILSAPGIAGVSLMIFDLLWFAAVWAVVGSVGRANARRLARRRLQARAT